MAAAAVRGVVLSLARKTRSISPFFNAGARVRSPQTEHLNNLRNRFGSLPDKDQSTTLLDKFSIRFPIVVATMSVSMMCVTWNGMKKRNAELEEENDLLHRKLMRIKRHYQALEEEYLNVKCSGTFERFQRQVELDNLLMKVDEHFNNHGFLQVGRRFQ